MLYRVIALSLAMLLAACGGGEAGGREKPGEHAAPAVKITTAMSRTSDVEVVEEALGRVLDPAATTVAAEVPGRVLKVFVDVGDVVRKGDLLAQLDAADMRAAVSAAEADVASYQARMEAQRRLVRRYRKLAEEQFVSRTMLEQAQAQLTALQKAVVAARARLRQAKKNLARTKIVAPVAGTVHERMVAAGDYIGVGKPMFQLVNDQRLVIAIRIPQTRIRLVSEGTPVRLRLPGSDQVVSATIDELAPMVEQGSDAFTARARINNPGGWRPGASVIAELVLATRRQAVVVPEECVVLRPGGEVVYLVKGNRVEARAVRTGVHRGGWIEILDGLDAGMTVAAIGASFLTDGANIELQQAGK